MFCVIQEIYTKKETVSYNYEKLKVTRTDWSGGPSFYGYKMAGKRFERPIKKAFRISIHESYRENGKVKKKQVSICTMGYYDLFESFVGDFLIKATLDSKLEVLGISEEELWEIVYIKLDPIIEKVTAEYQKTVEYRVSQEQKELVKKYQKAKSEFEKIFGDRTYDYCYDVFGELRNEEYLKQLKANYKAQQEYQKRSYKEYYERTHKQYSNSSYGNNSHSNYTAEEKELINQIIIQGYKKLSLKYHPDTGGTEEEFKLLGSIKERLLNL